MRRRTAVDARRSQLSHRAVFAGGVACLGLLACTPFRDAPRAKKMRDAGAAAEAGAPAQSEAGSSAPPAVLVQVATPCSTEGAQACAVGAVLACHGSQWQMDTKCSASERCEAVVGDTFARCAPAAAECVGHALGHAFCDGDVMLVCSDPASSRVLPCGKQQRCIMVDDEAICACLPGSVDTGRGCQTATSCGAGAGGCDPLTVCSMDGSARTCSACPDGYDGDGLTGCSPKLLSVRTSCGEVQVSNDARERRVMLPILCQRVALGFEVPPETRVQVDGADLQAAANWNSGVLPLGESTIQVRLTAHSGVTRTYGLVLDRRGTEDAYIKASNTSAGDCFGLTLAADGDTFLSGAPFEDSSAGGVNGDQSSAGAADSGAAYVHVRQGRAWIQQAYLKADAPVPAGYFGTGVAISGDTLVVGAPGQDPLRFSFMVGNSFKRGAAYVYVRVNGIWSLEAKLAPKMFADDDLFGFRVAVQGDTAFVAAPRDDAGATDSGAVYVFTRSGGKWSEQQKLKPMRPIANSVFGFAIAVDATTALIGAAQDPSNGMDAGSAYAFVLRDGSWQEQQRLLPDRPRPRATFGWGVALRGDTAVVTAPAVDQVGTSTLPGEAFVFERAGEQWTPVARLSAPAPRVSDFFGSSAGLLASALVIGANGSDSGAGAAFLFERGADTWMQTAVLRSKNLEAGDMFAEVATVTDDTILLGAPWDDSNASGINADPSSNSAMNAGAIYVYR